jgi:hypothetical protein
MDAKFERPMRAVSASGGMRWGNSMTEGGSELDRDVFESEESVTGAETGRGWKVEGESPVAYVSIKVSASSAHPLLLYVFSVSILVFNKRKQKVGGGTHQRS